MTDGPKSRESKRALGPRERNKRALGPRERNKRALGPRERNKRALGPRERNKRALGPRERNKRALGPRERNKRALGPRERKLTTYSSSRRYVFLRPNALILWTKVRSGICRISAARLWLPRADSSASVISLTS